MAVGLVSSVILVALTRIDSGFIGLMKSANHIRIAASFIQPASEIVEALKRNRGDRCMERTFENMPSCVDAHEALEPT